jgi:hypothetical protein
VIFFDDCDETVTDLREMMRERRENPAANRVMGVDQNQSVITLEGS